MSEESFKIITEEEKQKYTNVVEKFCKSVDNLKKKLTIKIFILVFITLFIILISKVLPNIIWMIIIPMFFIGKNIGQNSFIFGYAGELRREVRRGYICQVITFVEGCYLDDEYGKAIRGFRIWLKAKPRYYYLTRLGYKYYTHEKTELEMYARKPKKVKIVFTKNTRLILDIVPLDLTTQEIKDNKGIFVNRVERNSDEENEKLEAMLNRQNYEITSRCIKFPINLVKHKSENYFYYCIDAYYKEILHKRSDREINIIANKIKDSTKVLIDEMEKISENSDIQLENQIKEVMNELIDEVIITKIHIDYVVSQTNDLRKFIIL